MLSESPAFLYSILDPEYFEPIERYEPSDEYRSVVARHLGDEWTIRPQGFWTMCQYPDLPTLAQGWKIHVSSVEETARETLDRVLPVLAEDRVDFKFCSDPLMLKLSVNKNWTRTGVGKFLTIYPTSDNAFVDLIEKLHRSTRDLAGPFILSDRPYKDSKVIFYRYGGHYGEAHVDSFGFKKHGIRTPDGEIIPDERRPYFHLPDFVTDPLSDAALPEPPGEQGVLLNDRYRVKSARKFNAVGGIYVAEDSHRDDAMVLIREARPMMGSRSIGSESFRLLEKEARILKKLGPTGYMPQFVELFQEWEHRFLVQELLDAESLWGYAMNFTFESAEATPGYSYGRLRDTIRKIAVGLRTVHEHGIVLRDLTKSNVMFTKDDEVKFIDLEFAYEIDGDEPPMLGWTPGYASPEQQSHAKVPTTADDCYAMGALILDMITFTSSGYELNRDGLLDYLSLFLRDLRWPAEIREVVAGLTEPKVEARWDLDRLLEAMDSIPVPDVQEGLFDTGVAPAHRPPPSDQRLADVEETLEGITRFIRAKTDTERTDRICPASAEVFMTNPVNVSYGSAGIAHYLWRATGEVPDDYLDWTLDRVRKLPLPPGLFSGLGGVAVTFLGMDRVDEAKQILEAGLGSERTLRDPGFYYGAAGWGVANLHVWMRTREQRYLDEALAAGEFLLDTARENDDGLHWLVKNNSGQDVVPLGLSQGASGIGLFFVYLNAAQPNPKYLDAAVRALDFDLSHRQQIDQLVLWFPYVDAAVDEPKSPHMRFGSAGVGSALLRCWKATGESKYREFADLCAYSTARRITNKLWHDFGLAGFGEFLLDMHQFTGDENYRNTAFHLSEGLLLHRIAKDGGFAFGGMDLFRISCDFALGSAGIGHFLSRLLHPEYPRFLFPDQLLHAAGAGASGEDREAAVGVLAEATH